jgi:hypothetical protein
MVSKLKMHDESILFAISSVVEEIRYSFPEVDLNIGTASIPIFSIAALILNSASDAPFLGSAAFLGAGFLAPFFPAAAS